MRATILFLSLLLTGCAARGPFALRLDSEAIPDEKTAVMVSLAIFQGQLHRDIGDFKELAPHLAAYRYRSSNGVQDPNGDAWLVHVSQQEEAEFNKKCDGKCVGGEFYTMSLSAHDGRVLEFYIPQ